MKTACVIFLLAFYPLLQLRTTIIHAQELNFSSRSGIGISIEPTRVFEFGGIEYSYLITPVNIYVPIAVGPRFRLEPDFGVFSFTSQTAPYSPTTISNVRLGVGGLYLIPLGMSARAYLGPRIGFYILTQDNVSWTNISGGLSFGSEFYLSQEFSLGGEAQLNYTSFGQPSGSAVDVSRHAFYTNALFFTRWYFF